MLYFLAFHTYPYQLDKVDSNNYLGILKNIKEEELVFPEGTGHSKLFKNFVAKCLEKDIKKRYNIYQVMNDPWIKGYQEIQNEKDPHKRRIINREKQIFEKQEMFKSGSVIENKKFNRSRPDSAYSNRKNYSIYKTSRPNSSKNRISLYTDNDYINSGENPMEQNLILDND